VLVALSFRLNASLIYSLLKPKVMENIFIGVDFSKKVFDVSVLSGSDMSLLGQGCFDNNRSGCQALLSWMRETTAVSRKQWLFCGEHTGLYSVTLCTFLLSKNLFIWMENPVQIKQSSGMRRGKSDPADSRMIAEYAYRHRDKAKCYQLPDKDIHALDKLLSYRHRLVVARQTLLVAAKETRACYERDAVVGFVDKSSKKEAARMEKEIKLCEKKMLQIIDANEALKANYDIVSSIKGIALINTVALLVTTQNFTLFDNSRQYACYAGLAPFGRNSGTSVHVKPHVSPMANKQMKVLLTQAARSAIQFNPQMKAYYQRKIAEGKSQWLIINNVRNKLVHCVFTMVKNRQSYQPDYAKKTNVA
jgi:transposase